MKNKKILVFSIIFNFITCIMVLTALLRTKISSQMFDNLMIFYGVLYVIGLLIFIIIMTKSEIK